MPAPLTLTVSPSKVLDGYRIQPQSIQGRVRAYAAEAVGTFLFAFIAASAVCVDGVFGTGQVAVAIAQGSALTVISIMLRQVSGGQFNPAVTVAVVAARRQPLLHGVLYLCAQMIGACAAAGALRLVFGPFDIVQAAPYLGAPHPAIELSFWSVVGLEALMSFVLVCCVFSSEIDPRGIKALGPFAVGATIAIATLWAGPMTGGYLNPARAFAPALGAWHWTMHGAYWLGPLFGGLAAAAFYELLLLRPLGAPKL